MGTAIYSGKTLQKSKGYAALAPVPGAFNTHTAIDKDLHRRKRRVFNHAFTERAVLEFEPALLRQIDTFIDQISRSMLKTDRDHTDFSRDSERQSNSPETWSYPINMSERCRYLAADIMGEFGFGESFKTQTATENRFLIDAVRGTSLLGGVYMQHPMLKSYFSTLIARYTATWTRERYGELVKRLIKHRLGDKGRDKKDLLSFISETRDSKTGSEAFNENEVWAEGRVIIVAGTDTTSTALSSTLFYLSRYPSCFSQLANEVRTTFQQGSEIRLGPKLQSCKYLRACLDEAMRVTPPVGAALWREVMPGGATIDGQHIPAGVDVGTALYAIHHDETIFPDSFTFAPDRWLSQHDKQGGISRHQQQQQLAFNPFSLGTRGCVAWRLATAEMQLALAKTVWYFDMRRPQYNEIDGMPDMIGAGRAKGGSTGRHRPLEFQLEEHLTSTHDGPYLSWKLREGVVASELPTVE